MNSTNSKKLSSVQNRYRYRMTDKTPATPPHAPPLTEDARNSHPRGSFRNGTTNNVKIITVVVNRRDDAFHYDVKTSRINLVQDVWEYEILSYLNVRELALLRPTCRWCNEQWQEFLKRNTLWVPQQVSTIDEAMRVGFNLSKQKKYSKEKPLMVVLSEGEHVVGGDFKDSYSDMLQSTLDITCSNISFIGQGKEKTTVHGGFYVENKKNVTVKSLTLTNPNRISLYAHTYVNGKKASVEMLNVSMKKCGGFGFYKDDGVDVNRRTNWYFSY